MSINKRLELKLYTSQVNLYPLIIYKRKKSQNTKKKLLILIAIILEDFIIISIKNERLL